MITLRPVNVGDLEKIMDWRMRPEVTKWMYTDPVLTIDKQKEWYEKISAERTSIYRVINIDGVDCGLISVNDITEEEAMWAYYIAEMDKRSFKNAISLELSLYKYCFEVLGVKRVRSEVLAENDGVVMLHQKCGNYIVEEKKQAIEKNGKKYDVIVMYIDKERFEAVDLKTKYEVVSFEV